MIELYNEKTNKVYMQDEVFAKIDSINERELKTEIKKLNAVRIKKSTKVKLSNGKVLKATVKVKMPSDEIEKRTNELEKKAKDSAYNDKIMYIETIYNISNAFENNDEKAIKKAKMNIENISDEDIKNSLLDVLNKVSNIASNENIILIDDKALIVESVNNRINLSNPKYEISLLNKKVAINICEELANSDILSKNNDDELINNNILDAIEEYKKLLNDESYNYAYTLINDTASADKKDMYLDQLNIIRNTYEDEKKKLLIEQKIKEYINNGSVSYDEIQKLINSLNDLIIAKLLTDKLVEADIIILIKSKIDEFEKTGNKSLYEIIENKINTLTDEDVKTVLSKKLQDAKQIVLKRELEELENKKISEVKNAINKYENSEKAEDYYSAKTLISGLTDIDLKNQFNEKLNKLKEKIDNSPVSLINKALDEYKNTKSDESFAKVVDLLEKIPSTLHDEYYAKLVDSLKINRPSIYAKINEAVTKTEKMRSSNSKDDFDNAVKAVGEFEEEIEKQATANTLGKCHEKFLQNIVLDCRNKLKSINEKIEKLDKEAKEALEKFDNELNNDTKQKAEEKINAMYESSNKKNYKSRLNYLISNFESKEKLEQILNKAERDSISDNHNEEFLNKYKKNLEDIKAEYVKLDNPIATRYTDRIRILIRDYDQIYSQNKQSSIKNDYKEDKNEIYSRSDRLIETLSKPFSIFRNGNHAVSMKRNKLVKLLNKIAETDDEDKRRKLENKYTKLSNNIKEYDIPSGLKLMKARNKIINLKTELYDAAGCDDDTIEELTEAQIVYTEKVNPVLLEASKSILKDSKIKMAKFEEYMSELLNDLDKDTDEYKKIEDKIMEYNKNLLKVQYSRSEFLDEIDKCREEALNMERTATDEEAIPYGLFVDALEKYKNYANNLIFNERDRTISLFDQYIDLLSHTDQLETVHAEAIDLVEKHKDCLKDYEYEAYKREFDIIMGYRKSFNEYNVARAEGGTEDKIYSHYLYEYDSKELEELKNYYDSEEYKNQKNKVPYIR